MTVSGYPYPKCGFEPFIVINGSTSDDEIKATMAHELFHVFQFRKGMPNGVAQPHYEWWMEASATWAEDLVYPPLNSEQLYFTFPKNRWAVTLPNLGPLDYFRRGSFAPYAAYIWPFYLRQRSGGDPAVVGKLWEQSASMRHSRQWRISLIGRRHIKSSPSGIGI